MQAFEELDGRTTRPMALRPLFWSVDHETDPPILTVLLIGETRRSERPISWRLARRGATRWETEAIALGELDATDSAVLEAMAGD